MSSFIQLVKQTINPLDYIALSYIILYFPLSNYFEIADSFGYVFFFIFVSIVYCVSISFRLCETDYKKSEMYKNYKKGILNCVNNKQYDSFSMFSNKLDPSYNNNNLLNSILDNINDKKDFTKNKEFYLKIVNKLLDDSRVQQADLSYALCVASSIDNDLTELIYIHTNDINMVV